MPNINVVIPMYNEEAVFAQLVDRLDKLLSNSSFSIEVILVDDGSTDQTPVLMRQLSLKDSRYKSIILSRNFGHQNALSAGLNEVEAEQAVFIIDADLQDPPELLDEFMSYREKGYDVVYAVRENRKENLFKRAAYRAFYRIMDKMSYIKIPIDSGDFSLISRRVVDTLNDMPEESRFLRGMRSWIGFRQIGLPYNRAERQAGESKYSLTKLFKLAFDGIFNFSEIPIKIITTSGLLVILSALAYLTYVVIKKVIFGNVPEGFTGLLFVTILFGGIQLVSLGLIGEYVLRIFFQVKNRPLYIIKERIRSEPIEHVDETLS